jgi:hypothetical protein
MKLPGKSRSSEPTLRAPALFNADFVNQATFVLLILAKNVFKIPESTLYESGIGK